MLEIEATAVALQETGGGHEGTTGTHGTVEARQQASTGAHGTAGAHRGARQDGQGAHGELPGDGEGRRGTQ